MARKIYITDTDKTEAIKKLQTYLEDTTNNLTLSKKITVDIDMAENEDALPPIVYITTDAYTKMKYLVDNTNDEIGWHGIMRRLDKETYLIEDIILYPQEVGTATVTVDETKLAVWQMKQSDEIFNNIRMQGHSHVSMSVTPSSVDLSTYEKFLQGLDKETGFYLFLIINKKGECFKMLYDFAQNAIFEGKEICLQCIMHDETILGDWYTESTAENITKKVYNIVTAAQTAVKTTLYGTKTTEHYLNNAYYPNYYNADEEDDIQAYYASKHKSNKGANKGAKK